MKMWAVADLVCRRSPTEHFSYSDHALFLFQPEGFVLFFSMRASFEHPCSRDDMHNVRPL